MESGSVLSRKLSYSEETTRLAVLTQASRQREELDGLGVGGSRWTEREEQHR